MIKDKNIKFVVIAIPTYYNKIEHKFPNVKKVLDICNLIREDFSLHENLIENEYQNRCGGGYCKDIEVAIQNLNVIFIVERIQLQNKIIRFGECGQQEYKEIYRSWHQNPIGSGIKKIQSICINVRIGSEKSVGGFICGK